MMNRPRFWVSVALLVSVFLVWSSSPTQATVFAWKGEGGALHLSNDPEDVPETQRAAARQFTSKLAGKAAPTEPAPAPSFPRVSEPAEAYERGMERGLLAAERQMAMTNELLKTTLEAVRQPPPPPTTIIIQQPSDPIVRYVDRGPGYFPWYGPFAPYSSYWGVPYAYPYPYGFFGRRLVDHSHFFPGTRKRNADLFFPFGHSTHHGFLFGRGFVGR